MHCIDPRVIIMFSMRFSISFEAVSDIFKKYIMEGLDLMWTIRYFTFAVSLVEEAENTHDHFHGD